MPDVPRGIQLGNGDGEMDAPPQSRLRILAWILITAGMVTGR